MLKALLKKNLLVLLILSSIFVSAQDTLLTVPYNSKLDSIQSKILNQKRFVQVFLPAGYKAGSTDKYDVLYVLDGGNWNMSVVAYLQRFIQNEGHMPPSIIVSVTGIDRNIELTPTVLKSWNAATGGADKFLGYIKEELIPYINKTYPSNGDNMIWGHSLGGMFVTYAMLKDPGLFKSYIAADPSLWWDNSYVPKMAAERLPALKDSAITYFITGREGPPFHEMKIDTMEGILKQYAPASLRWKLVTYAGETHSSLRMRTTYDGLRFSYEGMASNIEFVPMNGVVLKDTPFQVAFNDDTTRVHYTLDGSIPTEASPLVNREITINGPVTVTYKRISNREKYGKLVTGQFVTETLAPPVSKLKNAKAGGLNYSYYEGTGKSRPDLKTAKPIRSGLYNSAFNADSLPRKNNYALVIDGFLEIKEDGYYTFFLRAGKGSTYWFDKKLVMHWADDDKRDVYTYMLPLSAGFYPVRIESFDKKEDFNMLFYYNRPGMQLTGDPLPVPPDIEFSVGKNRK